MYVGVQVKNKLDYPTQDEISQLIDITNVLHLKPILVARVSHEMRNAPVINRGGRVIIFKRYFLQPPFPRKEFDEINFLGIPLGVYMRQTY